jgi:PRC-barrel domain
MTSRILMATVAGFALAVPAAAQDKSQPLEPEQEVQQLQQGQGALPEESTAPAPDQPPAMAEEPTEAPADGDIAADEKAAPPADMQFIEVQEEAQFLANDEVIGKNVVNVMDEEVGTIADLVMDQEQKLVGVVLSVGGFLGIGEKWVAVSVDQIDFPTPDQPARLLVAVTEEQLTNAPDFTTRAAVEAEEAAEDAQRQATQQQIPPPATATPQ